MVNYTCDPNTLAAAIQIAQKETKRMSPKKKKAPAKKKSAKKASAKKASAKKQPSVAQQIKELKKMTTILKKKPIASPKPKKSNRGRSQIDPKMMLWNQKLAWWRESHRRADGSLPPLREAMQACKGKGANPYKSPCRGKKYTMPAMPEGFKYTPKKKKSAKKKSAKKASPKKVKKVTKTQLKQLLGSPQNKELLRIALQNSA